MITIIDYNMGNLGSIKNMLKKVGFDSCISSDPVEIGAASKLILPGVGAFDAGMTNLDQSGLIPVLEDRVLGARVPTLGICLGMQLMALRSSEGTRRGLGWIDAEVSRIQSNGGTLKVPHRGWNRVRPVRTAALLDDLPTEVRFYFVHSYYVNCLQAEDVLLATTYGREFHSGFHRGNVWGVQFHPEKSHRFGMHLLRNFAERC